MHPRIVRDAYHILGIPTTANIDEIRQAYGELALKWHPDRHIDDKEHATKVFFEVSHAYQALAGELEFSSVPAVPETSSMSILPTPRSNSLASAASTNSVTPSSQIFAMHSSNTSFPQTTPTSSLGESVNLPPKPSTREAYSSWQRNPHQSPITVSVPYQATNGLGRSEVPIGHGHSHSRSSPPNQFESKTPDGHAKYRIDTSPVPDVAYDRPTFTAAMPREAAPTVRDDPASLTAGPPLRPLGVGTSREWIYPLTLTLEELFSGKHCRFCIVRRQNSGKMRNVLIELDIPPGCRRGTRILCRGVGHQLPDGSLQDVAFVIEEAAHDRFTRLQDDLFVNLQVTWAEDLRRHPRRVSIRGIDGEDLSIHIEYARGKALTGNHGIRGAGMPIRRQGEVCGRGNLTVRWEIQPPQSRVRTFFGRFLPPAIRRAFAT